MPQRAPRSARNRDADKALLRGSARGTRAGRGFPYPSHRAARGGPEAVAFAPPRGAETVLRPTALRLRFDSALVITLGATALAYVLVLHRFPWFVAAGILGRALVAPLLARRHWIALTADAIEVRAGGAQARSVPRDGVVAIRLLAGGSKRIEFIGAGAGPILTASRGYRREEIGELARTLGIELTEEPS